MRRFKKEVDYYLYNHQEVKKSKDVIDNKWSNIIDKIKEKYEGTEMGNLIRYKYIMKLTEPKICELLNIESTTYYAWCNKVINEITLMAAYERLIIPF